MLSQILSQYSYPILYASLSLLIYCLYLYKFKHYVIKMTGDYNVKLKNIGRPLPPFPNGWYIVCRSDELKNLAVRAVDISGHNIVLFRSQEGKVFALHTYCAHLGANMGIGGTVVNGSCIQCPFHGWLYDGHTGSCVNHDGKVLKLKNIEYVDTIGKKGYKQCEWKQSQAQQVKLRKYYTCQMHGYIYVWIHVDQKQQPFFDVVNVEKLQKTLELRGVTIHQVNSHMQDLPENGADVFHFKYVHRKPINSIEWIQFMWNPQWMRGDNPQLQSLFTHKRKYINSFKQELYNNYVKDYPMKQYLSFANIDNYIVLPLIGKIFIFNLTVMQMGPGLVYVFFKTKICTLLFVQHIYSHQPYKHTFYHNVYTSSWIPYWITAGMIHGEAIQVYNDMLVWNAKKFGRKIYMKEDSPADEFIKNWREWITQFYQGCDEQIGKKEDSTW